MPAMAKKATAGLWIKSNLRVKRRDPWHRANAPSKAAADQAHSGEDANLETQTCLYLVCRPVAQPSVQASRKASLNNPAIERSWTALLRGRKLCLPWRIASGSWQPCTARRLMLARERE